MNLAIGGNGASTVVIAAEDLTGAPDLRVVVVVENVGCTTKVVDFRAGLLTGDDAILRYDGTSVAE